MKILFLYTELADYTLACLKALKQKKAEILVIHFPVNPEAPFLFEFEGIGNFKSVNTFRDYNSFKSLILKFDPDKLVCSGWTNKWYIRVAWELRNKTYCILTLDNHWTGNIKQRIISGISKFTIRKIFKKIWIPGTPQVKYANKLSFLDKDILKGFYSCDVPRFNSLANKFDSAKKEKFPHRFLCVARYIPAKGYDLLWSAFIEWKQGSANDWQLWCAGTGEMFDQKVGHPDIKHLGFIQNGEWDNIIEQTGVFILASLFEPWGVVVQEFSAAGYPLLISDRVGASTLFLNDSNGYSFDPGNKPALIQLFERIAAQSDEALFQMGKASYQNSRLITPQHWACTVLTADGSSQ
jgi:glycosyltransferase involved in cell wall biosynthesis